MQCAAYTVQRCFPRTAGTLHAVRSSQPRAKRQTHPTKEVRIAIAIWKALGGDAGPKDLTQIGGWSLGGSLRTGLHFFQVFITNNRQIHTNLWAPGGQTDNPFQTPGVTRGINQPNFFLGFNLARKFKL